MARRRRRRTTPQRASAAPAARVSRRRLLLGAVAVLVVLAGAGIAAALSPSGGGQAGAAAAESLPATVPVRSYQLVYLVRVPGAPVSREEDDVERPFTGRQISYGPAGQVQSGTLTTPTGSYLYVNGSRQHGWVRFGTTPVQAVGDQHALDALREAVRLGMAQIRGTRTVLGRRCTLIRTGSPIGAAMKRPTSSEYADLCVDPTGVILSQDWRLNGSPAMQRTAVVYRTGITFPAGTFVARPASSLPLPGQGQGSPVSTAVPPSALAKLPVGFAPPAGYTLRDVQVSIDALSGSPGGATVAHYVNATGDLLTFSVTAGSTGTGVPVRISGGARATLQVDLVASRLTRRFGAYSAQLSGGDPAELVRWAGRLHPNPAGGS